MRRIAPLEAAWPLHGPDATRALERSLAAALPAHTLMQRAGLATARLALALAPHAPRWDVLAGPGNNGGDALEAALQLARAGHAVRVRLVGDAARLPPDAADAYARAHAAGVPIAHEGPDDAAQDADIPMLDGLLGLGSNRAPEGALAAAIGRLNARRGVRLAIDLPSGLDARTGQPLGAAAVRATHTLSLLTLKPGLWTGAGRDHAGEVWLDTLGADLAAQPPDARLAGGADAAADAPRRHAQHKGSFGDVHVVGGAPGMLGAVLLAARAAHAAGAGRVYVAPLDAAAPRLDTERPELMFRDPAALRPAALEGATVLAGCGGGAAVRGVLPLLLAHAARLVLDADALNAIAADEGLQPLLAARAARARATLLTPHPLEAARLLGRDTAAAQADRLAAAAALAARYGCVVLLKGSGSVVAAPGEVPSLNPTGSARLASAGTGDVLAGWIAGLWAQQAADAASAFRVAVQAAFRHGLAADTAPPAPALRAAELVERLRAPLAPS